MEIKEYKKYKWFFTSSGKLVVGGKSASQNEELLKNLRESGKNYLVLHTSSPGSPFSVILADIKSLKKSDIGESAIFTACFSREWRSRKKKTTVDIFTLSQLYKLKTMKTGTWGVMRPINHKTVNLELAFTTQFKILRAVPLPTLENKKPLLKIIPGTIDKQQMLSKIALELGEKFSQEEILQALPSGGVKIKR